MSGRRKGGREGTVKEEGRAGELLVSDRYISGGLYTCRMAHITSLRVRMDLFDFVNFNVFLEDEKRLWG
jgi:hypothetical protein